MITHVETIVESIFFDTTVTVKRSDFKDGEVPRYTGHKRNFRKTKWSKHDFWTERFRSTSRCWKDQSKRRSQHKRVVHFDLYKPVECDEFGNLIVSDAEIEQLCHLVNTYPALFGI